MIVNNNQPTKAPVKKSFTKWKQHHDALFDQRKHIETTNHTAAFINHKRDLAHGISATNAMKFDLDFKKLTPSQPETRTEYQQFEYDCNNRFVDNFAAANQKRPPFHSMMTFSQLNRVARSEATRFNVPQVGQHDTSSPEVSRRNSCSCRCVGVAATSSPVQNASSEDHPAAQLSLQIVDASMEKAVQPKQSPTSKVLLANIVEEQIEIVEQQKQILKQQNEIFNLQYQIEKLLLMNGSVLKNALTHKQLQSITASSSVESNGSHSKENGVDHSPKGRKSIGVSCHLTEICSPVAMIGSGSPKDTMLERINKIIENSPPMINYKQTSSSKNCHISPRRTDINISSQT